MDVRAGWSTGGCCGPRTPSEAARLGTKSWAMLVGEVGHFWAGSGRIYGDRFAILGSEPRGWGVGDNARVWPDMVTHYKSRLKSVRTRF